MKIDFYKYQGAGNDFVVLDNRKLQLPEPSVETVAMLCDRRFGVGADGLMLLQQHEELDFEMIYYNADGGEGSMCGNGGRCMVAFAKFLGIIETETRFWAVDGLHEANLLQEDYVELKMGEVSTLEEIGGDCFLNTGSPHYIRFVDQVDQIDVIQDGKEIRYNDRFKAEGTNVNFVEIAGEEELKVATYERGVENETLACGTGVTAAALAYYWQKTKMEKGTHAIKTKVKGGDLEVRFDANENEIENIWLCGPATQVFQGTINIFSP